VATLMFTVSIVTIGVAQSNEQTVGEFWPAADAHIQFPKKWRLLGFVGLKKGEDFRYQQVYAGLGLGYQWKNISLYLEVDMSVCKQCRQEKQATRIGWCCKL